MSVISWAPTYAALNAVNFDSAANRLAFNLQAAGHEYDAAGSPDVLTESTVHANWRSQMSTVLARRDRVALGIDGGPATTIDSANPGASSATVIARLKAAAKIAPSTALATLCNYLAVELLPGEPKVDIDQAYRRPGGANQGATFSDIESGLQGALDEANAYLAAL